MVEVCAVVLVIETEAGERAQVRGFVAPDGGVTAQVRATVPVNELDGVTVTVAVVLAPAATVTLPLLERVKLVLPGACQKFAQPVVRNPAVSNSPAHILTFIAAPFCCNLLKIFYTTRHSQGIALRRILSRLLGPAS
jgi:hypothetical protein